MARPRKLTPAQEVELLQRYVGGERTLSLSHSFGVSRRTVERIYRLRGLKVKPGPRPTDLASAQGSSCLARWIQAHPNQALPRSPKEISTLTGCTEESIKFYLHYERKRVREAAKTINLRELGNALLDVRGRIIPVAALTKLRVGVAPWTFDVYWVADLKAGGHVTFKISSARFRNLVRAMKEKEVRRLPQGTLPKRPPHSPDPSPAPETTGQTPQEPPT